MIAIIDYDMGNVGSILNMLKKVGAAATITSSSEEIEKADRIILPGVGAFGQGMKMLRERNLIPILNKKVLEDKTPILGICLGTQLFTRKSEEGHIDGLGWIDAKTIRFKIEDKKSLKIPHMGWNEIKICKESILFHEMHENPRFYFAHSYHIVCGQIADQLTSTNFGYDFTSGVEHENIYGVQFHPEKSHKFGMRIMKNFVELA